MRLLHLISKRYGNEAKAAPSRATRPKKVVPPTSNQDEVDAGRKLVYFDGQTVLTLDDILCASAEVLGKGTYGTAYKVNLDTNNQVMVVKRLRETTIKAKSEKEFEVEVNILGNIKHPNLVALRAYYFESKGEKLLISDYMSNGSIAAHLYGCRSEVSFNWSTRMKIAKDMTRGLCHLHTHENVIHGNLTSNNILLDNHFNVKISDFGLLRLMCVDASSNMEATSRSFGHRAPELSNLKETNKETDIYSLGVIIFELLTGKPPRAKNRVDLPQWVRSIVEKEWTSDQVFDLELLKYASTIEYELVNTLQLAADCVSPSPFERPEVQQVLERLEKIRPDIA